MKLAYATENTEEQAENEETVSKLNIDFLQSQLFVLAKEAELLKGLVALKKEKLEDSLNVLYTAIESFSLFSKFSRFSQNEGQIQQSINYLFLFVCLRFSSFTLEDEVFESIGISTSELTQTAGRDSHQSVLHECNLLCSFFPADKLLKTTESISADLNENLQKLFCLSGQDNLTAGP